MNSVILLIAATSGVIALAAMISVLKIWRKMKFIHRRLHLLQQLEDRREGHIATISRTSVRTLASLLTDIPICQIEASAQHGEELFLWQFLGFRRTGVVVEIGAYDGLSLSNSLFFESIGWKTVLIEAHPELVERCRRSRPKAIVVHAALGESDGGVVDFSMVRGPQGMDTLSCVGRPSPEHLQRIQSRGGTVETVRVPARTLQSILKEHQLTSIDCMTVDVEGAELSVLRAADLHTNRPQIIVVEDNSRGTDDSVPSLLKSHHYSQASIVGCNVIFIRNDDSIQ